METAALPAIGAQHDTTKKHLRGSGLLLIGRILGLLLDFAAQVLIVHYLSKNDYGAFAYALSMVALGSSLSVFGMDKAITRFVPIYHEQRDFNKMFGTIMMMVGTVLSLGLALVLLVYSSQGLIARSFISDRQAIAVLLILIGLSPVQALDALLVGMFAIFASPRAIFFRKHVLGPGLELIAVLLLVLGKSNLFLLAAGYLAAGVLGMTLYTVILWRMLHRQGLFQHFNIRTINMPVREVFGFTLPLLSSDLVVVLRNSFVVLLLGYFHSTVEVAAYRAAVPLASQNMLVLRSFTILFTPMAARLFARNDREGINDLYWQSAIWIAVISFPIFAVTFSLARPLILMFYGPRYADSATILMLLAFGNYFNAALGFNGLTLRIFGKVRYIFVTDFLAAATILTISLLLVPRFGALGAALSVCGTLVAQNIAYQAGLRSTNIKLFEWRYRKVYLSIVLGGLVLLVVQMVTSLPLYASLGSAALVSLVMLRLNREILNVEDTFPELLRLPLARRLFGKVVRA